MPVEISFTGSAVTDARKAVITQAVAFCPPALFPHGLDMRIGNEFFGAGSPRTS